MRLKVATNDVKPMQERRWGPYELNGGTVVGVAGPDFTVMGCSTRMSSGYSILTRKKSKIWQMNDKVILGSAGMQADAHALTSRLHIHHNDYKDKMSRDMTVQTASQVLSNTLYYKRFFPYYTFNILGGVGTDDDAKEEDAVAGYIYSYDAIGSFERDPFGACVGSGTELITPLLDFVEKEWKAGRWKKTRDAVEKLVLDCFHLAAEKDIYTGDQVELFIVTKDGTTRKFVPIRHD